MIGRPLNAGEVLYLYNFEGIFYWRVLVLASPERIEWHTVEFM